MKPGSSRDRHGRGRIPDTIQREEVVHDLTEGEKPTPANVKFTLEGAEHPLLSEDRLPKVVIEAGNVEKDLPVGGAESAGRP